MRRDPLSAPARVFSLLLPKSVRLVRACLIRIFCTFYLCTRAQGPPVTDWRLFVVNDLEVMTPIFSLFFFFFAVLESEFLFHNFFVLEV